MNLKSSYCNVAILAGGKGTRLSSRSGELPKPMVPILGKPVLEYQIDLCRKHGFTNIALLVHDRYERICEHFGDGSALGVTLTYVVEENPRGTSGALRDALHVLADTFLLLYGDTYMDVDLLRIWKAHAASGAAGTLFLHPNDHPQDSDLVKIDADASVLDILPYPHPEDCNARNLVNAALYVLNRAGLEDVTPTEGKADIAKHMFPKMLKLSRRLYGYVSPEYIKDMGTPDRLDKVERDLIAGLPERLSGRNLRSAVFLDRDGTLNREINHLKSPDQIELLPGVSGAVRRLNQNGTLAVVVTNQPVLARGDITFEELDRIHGELESQLGAGGAFIDGLYICPHHPDKGFSGEVLQLKRQCQCRKPESGLIEQACKDLSIDRRRSWLIGDTTSDIEAGRRAGLRTILLRTGHAGSDAKFSVRPNYVCPDLPDAIDWVLDGHSDLSRGVAPVAVAVSQGKRLVLIGGLARTGKSFFAQVLTELLQALGRESHIISLDGWLKPKNQRSEGTGVCSRFDLTEIGPAIEAVMQSSTRKLISEPLYDRINGIAGGLSIEHSIGPEDILIVEGVPALLIDELVTLSGTVKVYIEVEPRIRANRLSKDYSWRGEQIGRQTVLPISRENDETPIVTQSRNLADFIFQNSKIKGSQ